MIWIGALCVLCKSKDRLNFSWVPILAILCIIHNALKKFHKNYYFKLWYLHCYYTLKLYFQFRGHKYFWSCISLFLFCFFSQLCSIDLIQASLYNSCAILLVKCTPLLQVCALLGLMFVLVPPLAYLQKCNSSWKQTICMLGAIPPINSQNFIFVNPLPQTL